MPTVIVTPRVKKQLTNISVGDKVRINAAGEIRVTTPQTKDQIIKDRYGHLVGNLLTLSEAADKYDVPRTTIEKWHYRTNYIKPDDDSEYPKRFDEAEIAYLAEIYHERKRTGSRAPLLDNDGLPYELKRPDVAEYRRNKKERDT